MKTLKRNLLYVLVYLFATGGLSAQGVPDSITLVFTNYFAFEDAVGNKDTVFISGKTTGNFFQRGYVGENLGDTPFDPVFEARLGEADTYYPSGSGGDDPNAVDSYAHYFIPGASEDDVCGVSPYGTTIFLVKCNNWPIKISWDENLFEPGVGVWGCTAGSALVDNAFHEVTGFEWWTDTLLGPHQFACLRGYDSWNFYYSDNVLNQGFQHTRIHPYDQPQHVDTLSRFTIWEEFFNYLEDECAERALTPTSEVGVEQPLSVRCFPNPVGERLGIDLLAFEASSSVRLRVVDLHGRQIEAPETVAPTPDGMTTLNVADWPPGLYYLSLEDEFGRVGRAKVVKQ